MLTAAIPHMTQRHKLKSTDLQTLCFSDALSPSQIEFSLRLPQSGRPKEIASRKTHFFKTSIQHLVTAKMSSNPILAKFTKSWKMAEYKPCFTGSHLFFTCYDFYFNAIMTQNLKVFSLTDCFVFKDLRSFVSAKAISDWHFWIPGLDHAN